MLNLAIDVRARLRKSSIFFGGYLAQCLCGWTRSAPTRCAHHL